MLLEQVFYNYYAPEDKTRVTALLKKHQLLPIIEEALLKMSRLIDSSKGNPVESKPIATLFSNTLIALNDLIFELPEGPARRELQQNTAQLGMRIIFYMSGKFPGQKEEILLALQKQFKDVSERQGYDYKDIDSLLNLSPLISMMEAERGRSQPENESNPNREVVLRFASNRVLNMLSFMLKQNKKIILRSSFESLFSPNNTATYVWPREDASYLAYLFYALVANRLVVPEGGKGYFRALEKLFTDEDGQAYPAERLKKLCFLVKQKRPKYSETKNAVDLLVKTLGGGEQ